MDEKLLHLEVSKVFDGNPYSSRRNIPIPDEELQNKNDRINHSIKLSNSANGAVNYWKDQFDQRKEQEKPTLPAGIPFLIRVEDANGLNLDFLRASFGFEIVSENEDGYVIVCSKDIELKKLIEKVEGFSSDKYGTGSAAKIYNLEDPENLNDRLKIILTDDLFNKWSEIQDDVLYKVDFSIECLGDLAIPVRPAQGKKETEAKYIERLRRWETRKNQALNSQENLQINRETEFENFIRHYDGTISELFQDIPPVTFLPDSFTARVTISGLGLKDIALNYPYVFEIGFPDIADSAFYSGENTESDLNQYEFRPPELSASRVCIIDSGIQEDHIFISDAVEKSKSYCFVPDELPTDVADYVSPSGHGTRVAGAVLYGENIPNEGVVQHHFWIRNARVLNGDNALSENVLPSKTLELVVNKFTKGEDIPSKIYNHSINSFVSCQPSRMSIWAASIDNLCWVNDLVFIQSVGNIAENSGEPRSLGILQHLNAGRNYPEYFEMPSSRIASPAESMFALAVGAINYNFEGDGDRKPISASEHPSSYSRNGLGLWGSIKPDVVEFAGDYAVSGQSPPYIINLPSESSPNLIRSSLNGFGPPYSKDTTGTSFAAPKVTHLAGLIQNSFPNASSCLIRSLIANSARWPIWTEAYPDKLKVLKSVGYGLPDIERALFSAENRVTLVADYPETIKNKEGHIYRIPIPIEMRSGEEFDVRIDVTLAFCCPTRRTRRHRKNYFGTWVDWTASKTVETFDSLKNRIFSEERDDDGINVIPWKLRERSNWGGISGANRSNGSLQKDWAILSNHDLPEDFCIAVVGHAGWDTNSEYGARYALSITIEAIEVNVNIYELIKIEVESLVEAEVEIQVGL